MDYLKVAAEKIYNASIVIWRDPSEGDGTWKDSWDGSTKFIMDCCYVDYTEDAVVLYRSKGLEDNEKGAEIYLPKGCIVKIIELKSLVKDAFK